TGPAESRRTVLPGSRIAAGPGLVPAGFAGGRQPVELGGTADGQVQPAKGFPLLTGIRPLVRVQAVPDAAERSPVGDHALLLKHVASQGLSETVARFGVGGSETGATAKR